MKKGLLLRFLIFCHFSAFFSTKLKITFVVTDYRYLELIARNSASVIVTPLFIELYF